MSAGGGSTRSGTKRRPPAADRNGTTACADGVADGPGPGDFADGCRHGDALGD